MERYVQILNNALDAVWSRAGEVNPWFAAIGVVFYIMGQAIRARGWHTIIREAYPDAVGLRPRHTIAAYLAGAGLNGVIPARGGDAVKVWLVHRRITEARYPTLVATFAPETLPETAFGVFLVVWAAGRGFLPVPTPNGELHRVGGPSFVIAHPLIATLLSALVAAAVLAAYRISRSGYREFRRQVEQGMAIVARPRRFLTGVVTWQMLGRELRMCSIAALMHAYGLPVTPATVLIVMAAQGSDHIIPFAGISVPVRIALVTTGLASATGQHIDVVLTTAYTFGSAALLMVAALTTSVGVMLAELELLSPVHLIGRTGEFMLARRASAEGRG